MLDAFCEQKTLPHLLQSISFKEPFLNFRHRHVQECQQVAEEVFLDADAACKLRGRSELPCAEQLLKHQGVGHADDSAAAISIGSCAAIGMQLVARLWGVRLGV